jgi:hypothetical protein
MASYAYKYAREYIPEYIIDAQGEDYEGSCDYDGDLWYAASDYIKALEDAVAALIKHDPGGPDIRLMDWLRTRKQGNYAPKGPLSV